jgi:hypothetical protein
MMMTAITGCLGRSASNYACMAVRATKQKIDFYADTVCQLICNLHMLSTATPLSNGVP